MSIPTPLPWADTEFVVEVIDMDQEMALAEQRLAAHLGPLEPTTSSPAWAPELALAT